MSDERAKCVCGEKISGHPDLCRPNNCCLDRGDDARVSEAVRDWRDRLREQRMFGLSRLSMGFKS